MEVAARARVRCAWAKFKELSPILTAQGASYCIKGKIYKACVQSALTYETETWAMKKANLHSLEQWRTEGGQRGRFAPGGTLRGRQKREKKKKKKRKKRKKREKKKKRKKNMGEACNFSKTIKWSILAAAPLCTYNLIFRRPYPFRRGRVVRLIIRVLHRAPKCIGALYILAPLLCKSTHTNLSNLNLPFWRPFIFWRPYAAKARIT